MRTGILVGAVLFAQLTLVACGEDKKDDDKETPDAAKWSAEVVKVASGKAEVTFDGAEKDQQYVLMPLSLGDPATVAGGSDTLFTFKVATAAGGGTLRLQEKALPLSAQRLTASERDHAMRTLLNHFDPATRAPEPWFWDLARRLDREDSANLLEGPGPIERMYRQSLQRGTYLQELTTTAAGDCPAEGGKVTLPDIDDATDLSATMEESIPTGGAVAGTDYCIVYLSDPVTGGTKAEIEATVKEVVKRYKTIYKSDFPAANGFTFKPVVVVLDFADTDLWPDWKQSALSGYGVAGAFLAGMSTATKMPMLYMSSDLKKVGQFATAANLDAAKAKSLWHGTIAHEMQHAAINYFRARSGGFSDDIPSIDEGLAHYMEDLFGYGPENFNDYAGKFLQNWQNSNPAIHATDGASDVTRGGAQTFLYYLISQKGGVTFTDGVATSGGGLDLIAEIVKSSAGKTGPANLAARMGGDWLQTVANYFGALVLDGTDATADDTLSVQDPEKIKDLTGGTATDSGMHHTTYGGIDTKNEQTTATTTEIETTFYATSPVLYTVTDPAAKVTFTTEQDAPNTAVVKVRLK
jgi:hypothetical protein